MTDRMQTPTVLLVDDDPAKRLGLRAVLETLGCEIVEADSGRAALRCLLDRDFAVILLDVRMPDMDGFETAALIRQRVRSELTPIIFITAYGSDEMDEAKRFSAGAVDFIFAPVPPEELRAKVAVFAGLQLRANALANESLEFQTTADQLRLLTDAAPIGIFRTDAQDRYVYTNPHWSQITGITAESATGQERDAMLGTELVVDPLEHGRRFALKHPGEAGTRVVRLVTSPVPDTGGGAPGWVGTLADVTAEVGAEAAMAAARDEATEASRTKSDFLANMSHEIRTPMNGVIGMTDLLLETDLDPSQRDYAQAVRNSGEALLTIINDILDFSKVEVGKLDVEAIEFALRSVAEDVTTLLAREAHAKGLELILAIDRDVPRIVVGDPGRVRQVLTNLIGNAIKFTHRGEVVVRVGATPGAEHEALIRFEISDTGDGIAADKLDLVFQPFVQADTSTSRRYGGTGLGLAISSHLVALMGGDCGVESELGSGSTFWFTVRAPYRQASTIPDLVAPGALAGVTALVVDGNATHRTVVSEYLSEWEIEVSGAASADAALAMMRAAVTAGQPFGLVLASGSALAGAVAAAQDLTSPLIVMTQIDDPHDGAHVTISKPVRRGALLRAVRDALHVAPPRSTAGRVKRDEAKRTGRGRLLVAEDNPINRKVAVAMLSGAGYEVDTVDDGAAAVEAATREFYDAILMDCQMPELSGYEATAQIRKLEGRDRHTPIIALTAGARREDRERCLAEGMDSYLAKPVNKEALLALVSHALKRGAPDTSSYGPMIDLAVFEELRSAGGEQPGAFLTDVIKCFIAESEPCLVDLRRVLDLRDAAAVGHYAHLLKGSCAQLGGRRLAASCERLERRALAGYLTLNRTDLEEVEVDYEDLRRALSRELEQLTKPSAAHHV